MKKLIIILVAAFLFSNRVHAQASKETQPVVQSTSADSAAIKKAAADYVEGYYNGDADRVATAVHPELAKRIIFKDESGKAMVQNMGASALVFSTRKHKKSDADPSVPFKITVNIYDIFNNTATIKIVTNKMNFIDYAQLAKVEGEWKIINVLWAFNN